MKRFDSEIVGSLFWILVGAFFALGATRLQVGTPRHIGPGFFPLVTAVILILFGAANLVRGATGPSRAIERIPWKRHAVIVACILLYGSLVPLVGFLVATFLLMSVFFGLMLEGQRKWLKVFTYSSVTAMAAWLTFSVVLRVPFPSARLLILLR